MNIHLVVILVFLKPGIRSVLSSFSQEWMLTYGPGSEHARLVALSKPAQNTKFGYLASGVASYPMEKLFIDLLASYPVRRLEIVTH